MANGSARVLVVDDHPEVRAMFSCALAQAGVADVLTAADGREALALIEHDLEHMIQDGRRPAVDLIVLDIMMPELSGSDVLRALRARFAELPPVLIISALDSPAHIQEAMDLGATEYLSKPLQIDLLRQKVRALIEAPASLREHGVANLERTEGAHRPRAEKREARRNAFWIG
jgi:two-component system response regulator PrrA